METTVTIYHNPQCSKSREALEYLQANGIQPTVVEYLRTPLDIDELRRLVKLLGVAPSSMVRARDFQRLELDSPTDADGWLGLIALHPELLERPVVVVGDRARIGRPVERLADLVDAAKSAG
ncbi:Arsenate reductase [Pirellulimonas nuda]|uniref:Arsenate reductase n=1 Tax=Pirellulimonas nuda TaxID=2528009 RepID=A0A518DCW5_9BACT|nr:arsenate reductase (glutaredoxin) [Pirellulimonas nuda]QDU89328.1 Arsenate reductase [Pirellulimonas nuda]